MLYLGERLSAFVGIPLDSHSLVNCSRHHTSPSKERVVDRIEGKVRILILERNIDDDEVMNMIKIIPETLFRNVGIDIPDYQVPGCANPNLIRNVARKNKLSIIPGEFKLRDISLPKFLARCIFTRFPWI